MNEDVQRFIDAIPADHRPLFDRLQALVLEMYPAAQVILSYQVPTYKIKTGWVALGYWKQGVSIYTNGPHHLAEFKAAFPGVKTGKGSINLRLSDDVPLEALRQVIRHAMENPKAG